VTPEELALDGGIYDPDDALIVPSPQNPLAVARRFVDEHHQHELGASIACHRGLFYRWASTRWVEVEERDVRSALYAWLEHAVYVKETKTGPELEEFAPNKYKVANVVDALRAGEHIRSELEPPAWREHDAPWGDDVAVAMRNGVLARSTRILYPHAPGFFNTHALEFAYDPQAPTPKRWLRFLGELWERGDDTVETLQETLGYILCGGTEQQKIFMFVGPKRSGKGTIVRVLTGLLGAENVCAPTLSSLATHFGLQPLVGKPLAAISDARLGTRHDALIAVERLLSISGEDATTIDRKYKDPWTGRLPTRFVVLTNEIPAFTDASGALASRFVIHTFSRSFYGHENPRLTDELLEEAPGIFNWCLEGFDRLSERGHFNQPQTSRASLRHLEDLASPVSAFLRDSCSFDASATVTKDDLWDAWKLWAEDAGIKKGTKELLIRDLKAARPEIRSSRPTINRKRVYVLSGLRLGLEPTIDETPDTPDREADFGVASHKSDGSGPVRSGVSRVEPIVGLTHDEHGPDDGYLDDLAADLAERGVA
jgi:putative DNA primase/helicase